MSAVKFKLCIGYLKGRIMFENGAPIGVSTESSTKVRETFCQTTQKLWATKLFKN